MNYEIKGTPFPVVICKVADGERMITEKGAMVCAFGSLYICGDIRACFGLR